MFNLLRNCQTVFQILILIFSSIVYKDTNLATFSTIFVTIWLFFKKNHWSFILKINKNTKTSSLILMSLLRIYPEIFQHLQPYDQENNFRTLSSFFFLVYIFFYWRIIALQNFAVFCQTSTWIRHRYMYISLPFEPPSHHPPQLIPPGWPRAPVWVSWAIQ